MAGHGGEVVVQAKMGQKDMLVERIGHPACWKDGGDGGVKLTGLFV